MKSVTLRRPVLRDEMRRYLLAFLLGFGSLLLVILPIINTCKCTDVSGKM